MKVIRLGCLLMMINLLFLTACASEEEKNAEKQKIVNYQEQIKELKVENGKLKLENAKLKTEIDNLKKEIVK